jgi:hypothetical protein
VLGGPALYLLAESLFRLRMIGSVSPKRIGTVIALCALLVLSPYVTALGLSLIVALALTALAIWEGQGRRRPAPEEPARDGAVRG